VHRSVQAKVRPVCVRIVLCILPTGYKLHTGSRGRMTSMEYEEYEPVMEHSPWSVLKSTQPCAYSNMGNLISGQLPSRRREMDSNMATPIKYGRSATLSPLLFIPIITIYIITQL